MRVLLALLLVGVAGCGGGSSLTLTNALDGNCLHCGDDTDAFGSE